MEAIVALAPTSSLSAGACAALNVSRASVYRQGSLGNNRICLTVAGDAGGDPRLKIQSMVDDGTTGLGCGRQVVAGRVSEGGRHQKRNRHRRQAVVCD
jgi:hypothetical protein